jgi:D-alanyl-D-alanine endopeptidase (penicillin-binding protein 7)
MIVKSKLIQAIFASLLSVALLAPATYVSAQTETSSKVKKQKAPKKPKRVRTTTTRSKSSDAAEETRPSFASAMGLRGHHDALNLKSSVALIIDRQTHEVLFEKNAHAALPIASITKLMTSLVVVDAQLPLEENIVIHQEDVNVYPGKARSRLTENAAMTREQALLLALMSSENRAAHALGRNYPGGIPAFVEAMNAKAKMLGMTLQDFLVKTFRALKI